MIVKHTYSIPAIWRPDVEGVTAKKLAGPCEVSFLKLIAGGGAAYVELYDTLSTSPSSTEMVWAMDASTSDDDVDAFPSPLVFKKGMYAVLTQGSGFNPVLCLAAIPSQI